LLSKQSLRLASLIVRPLVWLIWEFCCEVIAWYVEWPITKILTLGKFPNEKIHEHEQAALLTQFIVILVGIISLVSLGAFLAKLLLITGA